MEELIPFRGVAHFLHSCLVKTFPTFPVLVPWLRLQAWKKVQDHWESYNKKQQSKGAHLTSLEHKTMPVLKLIIARAYTLWSQVPRYTQVPGSVSDRVQDTTFHKSQAKGLGREIGMKLEAFAQAIIQEQVAMLRQLVILQYQLVDV